MCLSALAFFGLTTTYRLQIFKQVHQIVFHGKGGYSWLDVYNMPIWLRNFTFKEIQEYYDEQNQSTKKTMDNKPPEIARPDIKPTYNTKTSKK